MQHFKSPVQEHNDKIVPLTKFLTLKC